MRHTTSLSRRAAALLLALLLAIPAGYAAAGEQKIQTSTQIVDGLTYRNTVTVNNGRRVESYALELAPDAAAQPILVQGSGTIYAGASINKAVANAQAAGWHVLGGINSDFFSMATGVPMGIVIEDGTYKSGTDGENAMAITDGAVSILRAPKVSMSLYDHTSGIAVQPNSFNKARHEIGGIYLLNEHFSTVSTRSDGAGWYVRMKALPAEGEEQAPALTVNSALTLEVTELLISDQSLTIGPDEYILTAADQSGRTDAFAAFQVGDRVTLTTVCDDPVLSGAQWAGGVGDIMIEDGALTDSSDWVYAKDGRQPRTALGLKEDGTLVLYAVDGRRSDHSAGLSQTDLAEELLAQGCVTAVNLDGGGSTSFSLWVPGETGPALQNQPSDGKARSCATYLLLAAYTAGDGKADRLVLPQDGQVVLAGSSLELPQVKAVDSGLAPVETDLSSLTISSQEELGTVSGNVYTAGLQSGTDTLRLRSRSLEGTAQVHVVDQLTAFTVSRAGSSSALTSLRARPGDQVQLAVTGSWWGRTALRDFQPVTVTVQGEIGTVDAGGLFTAAQAPGTGSITFSAGGLEQTIQVTMANVHNDVGPDHWSYDAVEYCYEKGIVNGISTTLFGRDHPLARGDFMVMLHNAVGKPAASVPCTFTDVSDSDYFYPALAWAQEHGLASGTGDGGYAPKALITREQAFTLLYRALPLLDKSCPDGDLAVLDRFGDKDQISAFAQTPTATLIAQGLVSGGSAGISPQGTLTRAEMASLLYRVLEHEPITDLPPIQPDPGQTGPDETDPGQTGGVLALDQSQVALVSGGSVTLSASLLPAVEGAQIRWTSSDPDAAPVSSTGMVTNLWPGAETKTVTVTASWNGLTASCAVTCQPAPHTGTVTNTDNGVNVRSGPGTSFDKVGALRTDAQVVVLGRQDDWYQVLFRNPSGQAAIGYVSAEYLSLDR